MKIANEWIFWVVLVALAICFVSFIYAADESKLYRLRWREDTPTDCSSIDKSSPMFWLKAEIPETARPHGRKARLAVLVSLVSFTIGLGLMHWAFQFAE
jgi:hypothetical protein